MRLPELLEIIGLRRERVKVGDKQLKSLGVAAVGEVNIEKVHSSLVDGPFYGIVKIFSKEPDNIPAVLEPQEQSTQQS